jgi:cation:H+ antiporter
MSWLLFFVSAGIIVVAGTALSRYGDEIAEHTGLGGLWIGVLLMAGATSLPEFFTAISAAWLDAPDLAAGDLFGAVLTNMLTLGLIDLFYRHRQVWRQATLEHTLSAALAMALTGLAGLFILLRLPAAVWGVGVDTVTLAVIYVLGMRVVFRQEDVRRQERERERLVDAVEAERKLSGKGTLLRRASFGFVFAASALLVAAPLLAQAAKLIASETGVSATFLGSSLVAVVTSLPELVTSFAAVRLGAYDLAVGNLFGSNAFNMAVLFAADAAYQQGPILSVIETAHTVTALWGILLMNLGLMGIIYRAEKRFLLIEPDSLLMVMGVGLGFWVLYHFSGS